MYLDIFLLYLYRKTEKNETKEKFGHFAECISQNTRQSGLYRVARKGTLPSAKLLALGKAAANGRAMWQLCRVPRHSAKPPLPSEVLPSGR